MVKNLPASVGNAGDLGPISGSGQSPEKEMANCSSILAWEIPWMKVHGGLQSTELQKRQKQLSN